MRDPARRYPTADAVTTTAADTEKQRGGSARQRDELKNRKLLGVLALLQIVGFDGARRFSLRNDVADDF